MDQRIEKLQVWGCDVQSVMRRLFNDEEFFLECLNDVVDDPNFPGLMDALQKQDLPTAFDCAHALKGLLSNVGLTPMYNKAVEIVEPLRVGNSEHVLENTKELLEMKVKVAQIISEKQFLAGR